MIKVECREKGKQSWLPYKKYAKERDVTAALEQLPVVNPTLEFRRKP